MPTIRYSVTRDGNELELEIDYSVSGYHPGRRPSLSDPGEPPSGGDIDDIFIAGPDGGEFTPTAEELSRIERHIYETHEYDDD